MEMNNRSPIEEGKYEVNTISLLYYSGYDISHVLDRADVILEWIENLTDTQLRVHRNSFIEMMQELYEILFEIELSSKLGNISLG